MPDVRRARVVEADNWYVPGVLTAQMNEQLDTSDEPFGKVVKPLGFQRRHACLAELLWSPLPAGLGNVGRFCAKRRRAPLRIPPRRAAPPRDPVQRRRHVPFSAVVETYTNQLFEFDGWTRYAG